MGLPTPAGCTGATHLLPQDEKEHERCRSFALVEVGESFHPVGQCDSPLEPGQEGASQHILLTPPSKVDFKTSRSVRWLSPQWSGMILKS